MTVEREREREAGGPDAEAGQGRLRRRRLFVVVGLSVSLAVVAASVAGCATTAVSSSTPVAFAADVTPAPTPSATPTPTPTPVVTTVSVLEPLPFERVSVDDATVPLGESHVVTAGVDGQRTLTYSITTLDGVEIDRVLVSDEITTAPVAEQTRIGTMAPPAPAPAPPAAASGGGCDPNYADACVPIASDVDCAGGSGNGPAYLDGTARVVGSDVYGLDRDGDGLACE